MADRVSTNSEFFGIPTGLGKNVGQGKGNNDGLIAGSFETSPHESQFQPKGSGGGQNYSDSQSVTHTTDFAGSESYGSTTTTGGTSRVGSGIEGQTSNDTGAGSGSIGHDHNNVNGGGK